MKWLRNMQAMRTYTTAEQVRDRLAALERNQAWLARKLGVDISTVYRWLTEERTIPDRRLPAIAAVLGCSPDELKPEEPVAA
jgi:DNA-binding transcriptional regulator YdaS (Cro superfamily)